MLFLLETPSIGQVFLSMHASAMLLALEVSLAMLLDMITSDQLIVPPRSYHREDLPISTCMQSGGH